MNRYGLHPLVAGEPAGRSQPEERSGLRLMTSMEYVTGTPRCIIAMGLDKKPSPPKRKVEDHEEKPVGSWRDGECSEPSKSSVEQKSSKASLLVIIPGHEASVDTVEDKMENKQEHRKEEREEPSDRESEDSQKATSKNGTVLQNTGGGSKWQRMILEKVWDYGLPTSPGASSPRMPHV
ncbi:glutamate-rich protein 3 [Limosa lapponica baueri]|uniref:Glutamate-rich protein 3 n=1 Tax=Limosa lapponica baueri TaxID=1758121 RepID=A0A2I0T5I9_LIMLA|nr:glutamate-rich protein 3 [Limosa lapponica baueri]